MFISAKRGSGWKNGQKRHRERKKDGRNEARKGSEKLVVVLRGADALCENDGTSSVLFVTPFNQTN